MPGRKLLMGTPLVLLLCCLFAKPAFLSAQSFSPIPVTGFNQDVVAESGSSSLTNTSTVMDGPSSNKVMYSTTFRDANGFGGGGLPDNGTITDASGSYQLASYSANNALLIQRSQTQGLSLVTPSRFARIRLLALSTEGASTVNLQANFTDGTSAVLNNINLADWFFSTTNLVISGYGRCTRSTPASGAESFPSNPRMYYIEMAFSCTDREKNLQSVSISNVSSGSGIFPFSFVFAVSGIANDLTVSSNITNASCSSNGSVVLNISGSTGPYTVSWNTSPVQTGTTATNLPGGTYQASITDANSCSIIYPVTIGSSAGVTVSPRPDTSICPGASFVPNLSSSATNFSWFPTTGVSNPGILNPLLSPSVSTNYTVTCTTGPCSITRTFRVTVLPAVQLQVHRDTSICEGSSFAAGTVSNATIFQWSPATVVSNPAISNPILTPVNNITQYSLTATLGACSITRSFTVTLVPQVVLAVHRDTSICEGSSFAAGTQSDGLTFQWSPTTGVSNPNIASPVLNPVQTTFYTLTAQNSKCTLSRSFTVVVKPAPAPNAGEDKVICFGGNTVLNGSGGTEYFWRPGTYLSDVNAAMPDVTDPVSDQVYYLKVKDGNGCESLLEDTVKLHVTPPVRIFAGYDTIAAIGQPVQLQAYDLANSGVTHYTWEPADGLDDATSPHPVATLANDMIYYVTGYTSANCKGSAVVRVKVYKGPDIYVPRAFTPNSDGLNDLLKAIPVGIREFQFFYIYNRWGQEVFATKDFRRGWDGRFNSGQTVPGAYTWIAQGIDFRGKTVTRKGTVIILL